MITRVVLDCPETMSDSKCVKINVSRWHRSCNSRVMTSLPILYFSRSQPYFLGNRRFFNHKNFIPKYLDNTLIDSVGGGGTSFSERVWKKLPAPRNTAVSRNGNDAISLLWQLRRQQNSDYITNFHLCLIKLLVVILFLYLCKRRLVNAQTPWGIGLENAGRDTLIEDPTE